MANFAAEVFHLLKSLPKFCLEIFRPSRLLTVSGAYSSLMVDTGKPTSARLNGFIFFHYTYMVLIMVRLLATAFALRENNHNYSLLASYIKHDPYIEYIISLGFLDTYFAFVWTPVWINFLYFDYLVHFSRGKRFHYLLHDLMVINKRDFFTLNKSLNWTNFVLKMIQQRSNFLSTDIVTTSESLTEFPRLQPSI